MRMLILSVVVSSVILGIRVSRSGGMSTGNDLPVTQQARKQVSQVEKIWQRRMEDVAEFQQESVGNAPRSPSSLWAQAQQTERPRVRVERVRSAHR